MDLHGQRVVILGGTSGTGLATAKAAARRGAEVTVISRQPASIDRALAQLPPGTRGRAADLCCEPGEYGGYRGRSQECLPAARSPFPILLGPADPLLPGRSRVPAAVLAPRAGGL